MRTLASLCLIKITLLCLLLLDLPLTGPASSTNPTPAVMNAEQAAPVAEATPAPVVQDTPGQVAQTEEARPVQAPAAGPQEDINPAQQAAMASDSYPQGTAAARLAALATPRKPHSPDGQFSRLPVALLPALDLGPASRRNGSQNPAQLPLPMPPDGTPQPVASQSTPDADGERSFLDLLSLKSLPIPSFGGVQAAHAASLDMPVPSTPAPTSPFTPAEQTAPLSSGVRVIPGAPPLPASLSPAQIPGGAPVQTGAPYGQGTLPPLPQGSASSASMPAPRVNPLPSRDNADFKAGEIARQQQDILMLRQQMDQRLKDLQSAEKKMKEMIQEAKALEDQKVRNLVQMYANMKPRTAAQALESMDERVAVRILAGMAPKQSGEILTYTDPAKTAKFTELLTRMRLAQ